MPKVYATDLKLTDETGDTTTPRAEEWVRFRGRVKMSVLRLAGRLEALQNAGQGVAEMGETFDQLVHVLSQHVLAWNWTDLDDPDRAALPQPTVEALWNLDQEEIMWLMEHLVQTVNAPKN